MPLNLDGQQGIELGRLLQLANRARLLFEELCSTTIDTAKRMDVDDATLTQEEPWLQPERQRAALSKLLSLVGEPINGDYSGLHDEDEIPISFSLRVGDLKTFRRCIGLPVKGE